MYAHPSSVHPLSGMTTMGKTPVGVAWLRFRRTLSAVKTTVLIFRGWSPENISAEDSGVFSHLTSIIQQIGHLSRQRTRRRQFRLIKGQPRIQRRHAQPRPQPGRKRGFRRGRGEVPGGKAVAAVMPTSGATLVTPSHAAVGALPVSPSFILSAELAASQKPSGSAGSSTQ